MRLMLHRTYQKSLYSVSTFMFTGCNQNLSPLQADRETSFTSKSQCCSACKVG
jgi:hypothetical protein